jgi:flagellar hook-basal body complex protein FliE
VIPSISPALGQLNPSEWSIGSVNSPAQGTSGDFAGALSSALDSLQGAQAGADTAAQQLATGQATDPTQAVTAVENASLAMDLASQIQTKLVQGVDQVFQTQV